MSVYVLIMRTWVGIFDFRGEGSLEGKNDWKGKFIVKVFVFICGVGNILFFVFVFL